MRRTGRPRDGFVAGLLVFGALAFVTALIYPMLFFAGSQTRSESGSLDRWRARAVAVSGLKVASNLLRKERWYGGGGPSTSIGALAPFMVGTRSGAELGLAGPDGTFTLVCENAVGRPRSDGPNRWAPLHHIDLFSRGEYEGERVVAYGSFVMHPEPPVWGRSTDGFLAGGSATTKRLIRVAVFVEPELQAIEGKAVRDAIRARHATQSQAYLAGYFAIDWKAAPPAPIGQGLGDAEAQAYMDRFRASRPGGWDPGATFSRDRLYDLVLEGTRVARRDDAAFAREVSTRIPACPPEMAAARFFCTRVPGCAWAEPACATPDAWDLASDEPGDPGARHATAKLHELKGPEPDPGYFDRLALTPLILRDYEYGCSATYSASLTAGEVPDGAFRNPHDGDRWCTGPRASVSAPVAAVNYWLDDSLTGLSAPVFDTLEFVKKYYTLDQGVPLADGEVYGWGDGEPPYQPPGDPDGDGDGDGGGGGTGSFGGGFSG